MLLQIGEKKFGLFVVLNYNVLSSHSHCTVLIIKRQKDDRLFLFKVHSETV